MANKYNVTKEIFSERLKELMVDNNETTYSIGELLNLSAATISRYRDGKMAPKITTIYSIANHFNVNPVWLMGYDVEKNLNLKDEIINLSEEEKELLNKIKDKKKIIVVNKIDLETRLDKKILDSYIEISVKENIGVNKIKEEIKRLFSIGDIITNDVTYLSNARSIALLKKSLKSINEAEEEITINNPIDIVELSLKDAWSSLGEIIGETYTEELLDELFSRFCLGK